MNLPQHLTVTQPGIPRVGLRIVDREGLDEGQSRHYDLQGIEDRTPTVEVAEPRTDLRVTPVARVPLRVVTEDDLGLSRMRLVYRVFKEGVTEATTTAQIISLFDEATLSQHQAANYELELAALKLAPGESVVLHAEATDAYDLAEQHVGSSLPRILQHW